MACPWIVFEFSAGYLHRVGGIATTVFLSSILTDFSEPGGALLSAWRVSVWVPRRFFVTVFVAAPQDGELRSILGLE
jgi:hypothetical protein